MGFIFNKTHLSLDDVGMCLGLPSKEGHPMGAALTNRHAEGQGLAAAGARTRCRLRAAGAAPPRPKYALPAISTVKQTWLG